MADDATLVQSEDPGAIEDVRALSAKELVERFDIGVDRLDRRVFELTDGDLDWAWPEGDGVGLWPIRVLLGHLADAEISLCHRMRRVVAEPGCEIGAWDDQAFIDAGHYGVVAMTEGGTPSKPAIGADVAVVHTLRKWMTPWLRTLPHQAWSRLGVHPERGPMSVRHLLAYDVWHLERHAWYCNQKVVRLLGTEPAGEG
ncbi:MAG: DinB family protein [Planctomycetota bacterium]